MHARVQRVIVTSQSGKRAERVGRTGGGLRVRTQSKTLSTENALLFRKSSSSDQIAFLPEKRNKKAGTSKCRFPLDLLDGLAEQVRGNVLVRRAQSAVGSRERLQLLGEHLQLRGRFHGGGSGRLAAAR